VAVENISRAAEVKKHYLRDHQRNSNSNRNRNSRKRKKKKKTNTNCGQNTTRSRKGH